jgi:hypothetical protein
MLDYITQKQLGFQFKTVVTNSNNAYPTFDKEIQLTR